MQTYRLAALFCFALSLGLSPLATSANETIKKTFEAKFDAKADKITKTDHLGLYEVYADGQIVYTDEKATLFFVGNLIDAKNNINLTDQRLGFFRKQMVASLPLDLAIKQVRGSGKNVLYTFEDPNCGYCKRLAKDLLKIKDTTVYTFMIPILGEDSVTKTKAIWCAADRVKAWNGWMTENTKPSDPKKDCIAPIERMVEIGRSFQVTGTPTLIFADGSKIPGALPLNDIEKKLADLAKK